MPLGGLFFFISWPVNVNNNIAQSLPQIPLNSFPFTRFLHIGVLATARHLPYKPSSEPPIIRPADSSNMWPEVETTEKENKRELKLSGAAISERLGPQNSQLDRHIFELTAINLLNISDTTLTVLPEQISNLTNLQTLLLYGNQLERLPAALGALDKLKVLDVSRNQLKSVPAEIAKLTQLATVNLSNNQLEQFPTLTQCSRLSVLDVSNNRLLAFPDVCLEANSNLSEVHAKCNQIAVIPQQIVQLPALKHLGLASNRILVVPKVLAGMPKLKGEFGTAGA